MTSAELLVFNEFRVGREWMGPSLLSEELNRTGTAASATGYHLIGPVRAPYAKFYLVAPSATLTAALYAYYEAQ